MYQVPTDSLYKFCALSGLILIFFSFYYPLSISKDLNKNWLILQYEQSELNIELNNINNEINNLNETIRLYNKDVNNLNEIFTLDIKKADFLSKTIDLEAKEINDLNKTIDLNIKKVDSLKKTKNFKVKEIDNLNKTIDLDIKKVNNLNETFNFHVKEVANLKKSFDFHVIKMDNKLKMKLSPQEFINISKKLNVLNKVQKIKSEKNKITFEYLKKNKNSLFHVYRLGAFGFILGIALSVYGFYNWYFKIQRHQDKLLLKSLEE